MLGKSSGENGDRKQCKWDNWEEMNKEERNKDR